MKKFLFAFFMFMASVGGHPSAEVTNEPVNVVKVIGDDDYTPYFTTAKTNERLSRIAHYFANDGSHWYGGNNG